MKRLLEGYARFRADVFPKRAGLFQNLANHQKPSTLFITCSDSRIVPDMVLQSDPGDLFICRNAGNIEPSMGDVERGLWSTIEYAVLAAGGENIIVCGHSDWVGSRRCPSRKHPDPTPTVDSWLQNSSSAL